MKHNRPTSVLLATEGTYPFYTGGVSTWCQRLTHGLSDIDFTILAIVSNPFPQLQYDLPPNVLEVIKVPQWGLLQPAEYSQHQLTSVVLGNRWNTTPEVVSARFKPLFERLLALVLSSNCDKEELGRTLLELQGYFQHHDYEKTMNSHDAWHVVQHAARATWECRPAGTERPTFEEIKQAHRLLYHFLMVLHFPIPFADLTHASAASFCGLPCVLAKLAHGTPYLLTEHGVYIREQYLNLRRQIKSFFVRWFLYRVVQAIVELNYHFADCVVPVCAFNARWEKHLGVPERRIKVIFNGADPIHFYAREKLPRDRPLISTVGLIYSLKGQMDLIEAAALLKTRFDTLEMRFYGAANDEQYFTNCRRKVSELNLEDCVVFAGPTQEPWNAYSQADVVAFSSVSEGFPYAVIEAMLCGAAIVATDVGGVREAVGNCGILVPAKSPQQLAEALRFLLENPQERERLGQMAQARALRYFTEAHFLRSYEQAYGELLSRLAEQSFHQT
ncbi:MAG TPA: GT4 family glycosyltransferase PelF [Terriglobales bacterium]|nr:GT4 family glycosyltransferase PelF [Terriglobales bacterium]